MKWAVLLCCVAAIAAESLRDVSKKYCKAASEQGSVLGRGMSYKYSYHAKAEAASRGATDDRSYFDLRCSTGIKHAQACFYELEISSCKITAAGGAPESEEAWLDDQELDALSQYPVLFSLSNGELETVFSNPSDPLYSVNIKKGIISLFAIPLSGHEDEHHLHRDVQGHCPRHVTKQGDNVIHTCKTVHDCHYPSKPDWQYSPTSLVWNSSFVQYMFNSTNDCDYTIGADGKTLETGVCHERHVPLIDSSEHATLGPQINIHYELKYEESKKIQSKKSDLANLVQSGIEYDFEHTPDPEVQPEDFLNHAQHFLSDLVLTSEEEIKLENIPMYHNFIAYLRSSSDLLPFVKTVTSCSYLQGRTCNDKLKETGKQFLQGALVQCNTIACMKAITHLAVYEQLSPTYLNIVLYSWTNLAINKPRYLDEILAICKSRDYRLCWLSLGNVISKYVEKHPEALTGNNIPEAIPSAVNHLSSFIGERCNIDEANFPPDFLPLQKYDYMRGILKAIGNMGKAAYITDSSIIDKLNKCVLNTDLHPNVRIAAIESMEKMEGNKDVHRKLMSVLKDNTQSADIRITAYHVLAEHLTENDVSAEDIAEVLKTEKATQVKSYIVSHLRNVINQKHPSEADLRIIKQINEALQEQDIDLDDTYIDPLIHSHNTRRGIHFEIPFLPKKHNKFGYDASYDVLFTPQSALPYSVSSNITVELFSKIVDLFEGGISSRDWESFDIWQKRLSGEASELLKWVEENAFEVFQRLGMMGDFSAMDPEIAFLDQRSKDSIKRLKDSFYTTIKKNYPTFLVYLKMFGNEIDFGTLQDIFTFGQGQYFLMATTQPLGSLKDGLEYSASRGLRLIESHHIVPTLMGVPFNVSTNLTQMYSLRSHLKVDTGATVKGHPAITGGVGVHPSGARSLINRMVIDIPTITQIGLQANISVYTSTRFDVDFVYSEPSDTRKFSIQRPTQPQRYFEIYRTNQIIKHNTYQEVADHDVQRVDVKSCTSDKFSSVVGIQFCRERSHVNVTYDKTKPWFFVSGSAMWKIYSKAYDTELKSFNIAMDKPVLNKEHVVLKMQFDAPGSLYKREASIDIDVKPESREGTLLIKVPENPEFEVSAKRVVEDDGDKKKSVDSEYKIQMKKNKKYYLKYNNNVEKKGKRKYHRTGLIDFTTPNNHIKMTSDIDVNEAAVKGELEAVMNNNNPDMNVFKRIFPSHYFESDSKAWMKIHIDIKDPKPQVEGLHRQGSISFETPEDIVLLEGSIAREPHLNRFYDIKLTKKEKSSQKLLAFANFLLDISNTTQGENNKIVGIANFTIPRHSYGIRYQREVNESDSVRTLSATRVKLIPNNEADKDYVGFYDEAKYGDFTPEERKLRFRMHLHMMPIKGDQLPDKIKELYASEEDLLWGRHTIADVALVYPFHEQKNSITFRGNFCRYKHNGTFLSLSKDYSLHSSATELQVDSKDTLIRANKFERSYYDRDTTVTYTPTGGKAEYHCQYQRLKKPDNCYSAELHHSLKSDMFNFVANNTMDCYPGGTVKIDIHTDSPYWDKLKFDLKQTSSADTKGTELVEYSGPFSNTKVTSEWDFKKDNYFYNKDIDVKSHHDLIPTGKYSIRVKGDGSVLVDAEIPEFNLKKLTMTRTTGDKDTEIIREITHIDSDSDEEHKDLFLKFKLYNPTTALVRGNIQTDLFTRLFWIYREKLRASRHRIYNAIKDPEHPLNKMLKPHLKSTIYEKAEEITEHVASDLKQLGKNFAEVFDALKGFHEPYTKLIKENCDKYKERRQKIRDYFEHKSLTGWAYHYYGIPEKIEEEWTNRYSFPEKLEKFLRYFTDSLDQRDIRFEFSGQHPFYWQSARKYPTFSKERMQAFTGMKFLQSELTSQSTQASKVSKTAMIFGNQHVYTYDGVLYEFPEYSANDCYYLLSHDVRASSFSALISKSNLKLVFPEVTITIDNDGKIMINGIRAEHPVPYHSPNGQVTISRMGGVIKVETAGFKVLCEKLTCLFNIGPDYRGGVIGLLGNGDGEDYNEFLLPSGAITSDIGEFVNAYEIGDKSQCKKLVTRTTPQFKKTEKQSCADLGSGSPLPYLACVGTLGLDEKAFKESCMYDVHNGQDSCPTEDGLAALCYFHGIRVTPQESCLAKDHFVKERVTVAPQLEVIAVVNQHSSMFPNGLKGLEVLLNNIQSSFESAGFSDIVYGLVGFGEKSKSNQIYSASETLLVPKDILISKSFVSMAFQAGNKGNAIDAVRYAASMIPPKKTSMRIYLLLTSEDTSFDIKNCGVKNFRECILPTVSSAIEKFSRLGRLATALKARADVVYTFAKYSVLEENKAYGVRPDNTPIPRGDKVDYPEGDAAKLSELTEGAVFQQTYVENNQPAVFFKEAVQEMVTQVSKHLNHCRDCRPSYGPLWEMRNACVETHCD